METRECTLNSLGCSNARWMSSDPLGGGREGREGGRGEEGGRGGREGGRERGLRKGQSHSQAPSNAYKKNREIKEGSWSNLCTRNKFDPFPFTIFFSTHGLGIWPHKGDSSLVTMTTTIQVYSWRVVAQPHSCDSLDETSRRHLEHWQTHLLLQHHMTRGEGRGAWLVDAEQTLEAVHDDLVCTGETEGE